MYVCRPRIEEWTLRQKISSIFKPLCLTLLAIVSISKVGSLTFSSNRVVAQSRINKLSCIGLLLVMLFTWLRLTHIYDFVAVGVDADPIFVGVCFFASVLLALGALLHGAG